MRFIGRPPGGGDWGPPRGPGIGHGGAITSHWSAPPRHVGYVRYTDWPEIGGMGPRPGPHIPGLEPREAPRGSLNRPRSVRSLFRRPVAEPRLDQRGSGGRRPVARNPR